MSVMEDGLDAVDLLYEALLLFAISNC